MVDVAYPAGSQHGDFRKYRVNFVFFQVQDICAETGNVGRTLPDQFTQMVLREDIDGNMVLENLYVVVPFHLAHQRPLDLMAGDILVVQDTVFAVAAFTGQFIASGAFFVELDSPRDQVTTCSTAARSQIPAPQTNVSRICFSNVSGSYITEAIPPWA